MNKLAFKGKIYHYEKDFDHNIIYKLQGEEILLNGSMFNVNIEGTPIG